MFKSFRQQTKFVSSSGLIYEGGTQGLDVCVPNTSAISANDIGPWIGRDHYAQTPKKKIKIFIVFKIIIW